MDYFSGWFGPSFGSWFGEDAPGAVQSSLSGAATVSATLTAVKRTGGGGNRKRLEERRKREEEELFACGAL